MRSTLRTCFHALTYLAGVLPATPPDHAYHGVFGSGIGRTIGAFFSVASCAPSARRPPSNLPFAMADSEYDLPAGPSLPLSGIQLTRIVSFFEFASVMSCGSRPVPAVTYTETVLMPGPTAFDSGTSVFATLSW